MKSITFRWLGVAGIELTVGSETLLIDPFLTRPPFRRLGLGRVEPDRTLIASTLKSCEMILVSHAHYDHLLDVPEIARLTGAQVLGSANTCALLTVCGLPESQVREIHCGDKVQHGSFSLQVVTARHARIPGFSNGKLRLDLQPPLRLRDFVMDECFSFLVQVSGLRLLVWNDAYNGCAPPAEVLFVKPSLAPAYCKQLLQTTQAKLVVPVHWDNFFRPIQQPVKPFFAPLLWALPSLGRMHPHRFREQVRIFSPGTQVLIPSPLTFYELNGYSLVDAPRGNNQS
jgi:L-ascorbate metabolism protein UlaG (beta-lactamase superfamily)